MEFIKAKTIEKIQEKLKQSGYYRPMPDEKVLIKYQQDIERSNGFKFPLRIVFEGFLYAYGRDQYSFYDVQREKFITTSTNAREEIMDGISYVLTGYRWPLRGDSDEYNQFHKEKLVSGLCNYMNQTIK